MCPRLCARNAAVATQVAMSSPTAAANTASEDAKATPAALKLRKNVGVPRAQRLRGQKYEKNIEKRGHVVMSSKKKKEGFAIGPALLGFLIFVVVGSSLFQIIRTAQTSQPL